MSLRARSFGTADERRGRRGSWLPMPEPFKSAKPFLAVLGNKLRGSPPRTPPGAASPIPAARRTKPDSYHSYGAQPNGIRVPSLPALPLQLNGLHIPSYQEAASTTKQIPYHSCLRAGVQSPAFSSSEGTEQGQKTKGLQYHSYASPHACHEGPSLQLMPRGLE